MHSVTLIASKDRGWAGTHSVHSSSAIGTIAGHLLIISIEHFSPTIVQPFRISLHSDQVMFKVFRLNRDRQAPRQRTIHILSIKNQIVRKSPPKFQLSTRQFTKIFHREVCIYFTDSDDKQKRHGATNSLSAKFLQGKGHVLFRSHATCCCGSQQRHESRNS